MLRLIRNRVSALAALALAVGMLAVACGNGEEASPGTLVPEGTALVAEINLTAILGSEGLAAIAAAGGDDEMLDSALDGAYRETGVDIRQISQVVVFGGGLSGLASGVAPIFSESSTLEAEDGEAPFVGAIVKGNLDQAATIAAIERLTGLTATVSEYNSRQVHRFEVSQDPVLGNFAIAFLDREVAVLGTTGAVSAVIDVRQGDSEGWSGPLRDAFDGLGPGMFRVGFDVRGSGLSWMLSEAYDLLSFGEDGGLESPAALTALLDLDLLTLSASQNGEILVLRMDHHYRASESAGIVGDLVEGLAKVGEALVPDASARELLDRVEVSRRESHLTVRLEAPASLIASLVSSFVGGLGVTEEEVPEPIAPLDSR